MHSVNYVKMERVGQNFILEQYLCLTIVRIVQLSRVLFLLGTTPQAESLARGIKEKLNQLRSSVASALVAADKSGLAQTAHTVSGRLEQANKWLLNPQHDDRGLGQRAIAMIIHEGKKVTSFFLYFC